MARDAGERGLRVIAVTSAAQSMAAEPGPAAGQRLLEVADLVLDLCSPPADARVTLGGLETPVRPGSTSGAIAIIDAIRIRTAESLAKEGAMPPMLTGVGAVGAERSRALSDEACREHSRRLARAIDHSGGG